MRETMFLVALLAASAAIVNGVAHWSAGVAWIVAGVLLAVVAWLVLGGEPAAVPAAGAEDDGELVE